MLFEKRLENVHRKPGRLAKRRKQSAKREILPVRHAKPV
jgi:hypothetical protein